MGALGDSPTDQISHQAYQSRKRDFSARHMSLKYPAMNHKLVPIIVLSRHKYTIIGTNSINALHLKKQNKTEYCFA